MRVSTLTLLFLVKSAIGQETSLAPYIEPSFPFFSTMLEAGKLGPEFPDDNLMPRGIVLNLGHGAFACFDQDLLRMAVCWVGNGVTPDSIPMASYHAPHRKADAGQNKLPRPLGQAVFATGLYPGLFVGEEASFVDPRAPGPDVKEVGRGPLPDGQFQEIRRDGQLRYSYLGATVTERVVAHEFHGTVVFERRLELQNQLPLGLVLAEEAEVEASDATDKGLTLRHRNGQISCFAFAGSGKPRLLRGRYVVATVAATSPNLPERCFFWRGKLTDAGKFGQFMEGLTPSPKEELEPAALWPETVNTKAKLGDEQSALVLDDITLPLANPWKRNVRSSGLDFFPDGRLALCTIDGDVWLAEGMKGDLADLRWRRIASGLGEPQSLVIRDGVIHVFTRNGIIQLVRDHPEGETSIYRVFSDRFGQTAETREYPMDMVLANDGGFYIAKGGQQETRPGKHNGRILHVSKDGQQVQEISSGHRQPYLGYHSETGLLTSTDQQGHYVPSTPIRVIKSGDYYGFHGAGPVPEPAIALPLCWIPHAINQSAAGQVWATHPSMGELNGRLIHLGYHRPALFSVLFDMDSNPPQGGVIPLAMNLDIPLLKGRVNPVDGFVYLTGFQIWGTSASKLATLVRLRPGKKPMNLPTRAITAKQGLLLSLPCPLKPDSVIPANFLVQRWNYRRRPEYGSGHFKLDGNPGQERLELASAHLSKDGKSIFLAIPDMRPAMQFTVDFDLLAESGEPVANAVYLTINALRELDLLALGFGQMDLGSKASRPVAARAESKPSAEKGQRLAETLGCLGCHSINGSMEGMKGPSWKGLFGSERNLISGEKVKADSAYLLESILDPNKKVSKGFQNGDTGMPPYQGILDDVQLSSLLLYLEGLR